MIKQRSKVSEEFLETGFIYLIVTTVCTLKCKYCTIAIPEHKPKHESLSLIKKSLRELFNVYDFVNRLIIQGGEAFLHPEIEDIIREAVKYRECFDHILFITNGTFVPRDATIELLSSLSCKYQIRIDDYGFNSRKFNDLIRTCEEHKINLDVRRYNEKNQYCGGWVDVIGGYRYKEYSLGELNHVFKTCLNRVNCKFVWGGKLWGCGMHGSGVLLGKVPEKPGDAIDLFSSESIESKREIARKMGSEPYTGCNYCNGFDSENSIRIPAAEQIVE